MKEVPSEREELKRKEQRKEWKGSVEARGTTNGKKELKRKERSNKRGIRVSNHIDATL
jgi:hypothetical protein